MDINNVSTFITLDPSKLFNAEGFYKRAMVMYEGDEDLVESFLKEHLASDSLAYAMHLLEETSSTSYMGVKIHYNGTSFSAPTAGVYGVKSRPEIKARIKAKVLKRNETQNKAAALKKEGYDNTKSPDYEKKKKALAKKHGGEDKIKGHPQYEEKEKGRHPRDQKELDKAQEFIKKNPKFGVKEEVIDEMNTELSSIKQKFKGKMTKSSVVKRLKDKGESKREFRNSYKKDIDTGYVGPHKPTKSNLKTALKKQNEEVEVITTPEGGCTTRKDQLVNVSEEGYDRIKDKRAERGGHGPGDGDNPSTRKPNYGKPQTDAEKKKSQENSKKAFDFVVNKMKKKYGDNAVLTKKEAVEDDIPNLRARAEETECCSICGSYKHTTSECKIKKEAVTPPKDDSKVKRQNMLKRQVLMKKLQAVRAGGGADVVASYQPEGELVTDEYTVTNADKKGNTKAWQNYKSNKKNVKTGKPLYKAADHVKEDSDLDTKFAEVVSENSSLDPQSKAIDVADSNTNLKGKKKGNVIVNPEVKTNVDESMETNKDNLQEVDMNTRSVDYGQEIKNAEPIKKKKPLRDFKKLAGAAAKNKKLG